MSIIGASAANSNSNLGAYIEYNGVRFNSPRFRSRIELSPEYSADGRTTLCNRYRVTVRAVVTDDESGYRAFINSAGTNSILNRSLDQLAARDFVQKIRSRLTKNAAKLIIYGLGFDIRLNTGQADSMFDVRWGPKTTHLEFNNIGNGVVWQMDWVFEFSLPECINDTGSGHYGHTKSSSEASYISFPFEGHGAIEGLIYEVAYTIDNAGLTQRVITGEASAAINRASTIGGDSNKLFATADELRERIEPDVPRNFRRTQSNWNLSSDKRMLRFVITDTEMPSENNYPPGIVDLQLEHSVTADPEILPVAPRIFCTIVGHFEVAKGYAVGDAFDRVLLIAQTRMDKARTFLLNQIGGVTGNPIFIVGFSITESLYGPRRVNFALNYMIMNLTGVAAFGGLVPRTGLFTGATNDAGQQIYSWDAWAASMAANGAWGQRGVAKLAFRPEEDSIVGPCDGSNGTLTGDIDSPTPISEGGGSLVTDCPPEGKDYFAWDVEINTKTNNNEIVHTPMAAASTTSTINEIKSSDSYPISGNIRLHNSHPHRGSYTAAGSVITFVIEFLAIRFSRPPEIPTINVNKFHELYNDGRLVAGPSETKNTQLGKLGNCSLAAASGYMEYTLTSVSTSVDIAAVIDIMRQSLTASTADPSGDKLGGLDDGDAG